MNEMNLEALAEQYENELFDRYNHEGGMTQEEFEVKAFEDLDPEDYAWLYQ